MHIQPQFLPPKPFQIPAVRVAGYPCNMRGCVILQALNWLAHAMAAAQLQHSLPTSLVIWGASMGASGWHSHLSSTLNPNHLDKPELKHICTCWEPSFDTSVVYLNLLLSKGPQEAVLWGCYISFCFWWIPLITHLDWNWVKFVSLLSILCFKHDTPILKVWTRFGHSCPLSAQLWKLLEISEGHAINVLVIEQGSINSYRRCQDVTRNKMTLKLIHLSAFATALQFIVPELLYKY